LAGHIIEPDQVGHFARWQGNHADRVASIHFRKTAVEGKEASALAIYSYPLRRMPIPGGNAEIELLNDGGDVGGGLGREARK
jgi:hypothetical protein